MLKIKTFILHSKAWQLFAVMFGFPFLAQMIAMPILMGKSVDSVEEMREKLATVGFVLGIITAAFMVILLGWLWVLGNELNKMVRKEIRMKKGLFNFSAVYPFFYLIAFMVFWISQVSGESKPGLIAIILPLHLISMFCIFYALYFVSKNLAMTAKQEVVRINDYVGGFLLLWFFPVGIWFIQPLVNDTFKHEKA